MGASDKEFVCKDRMQISPEVEIAFSLATREAARRRHEYVTVEHLLYALLFDQETAEVLRHAGGDAAGLKKKLEKYRWYWLKRSFDRAHDYTNLFVAADVLNATNPESYTSQTEALFNVDQWMGIFAAEDIINKFDSWGHEIGTNR